MELWAASTFQVGAGEACAGGACLGPAVVTVAGTPGVLAAGGAPGDAAAGGVPAVTVAGDVSAGTAAPIIEVPAAMANSTTAAPKAQSAPWPLSIGPAVRPNKPGAMRARSPSLSTNWCLTAPAT